MNTYPATFLFFFCCIIITTTILSLFTLGSIYSTYASGAEKMTETKSLNQTINRFKNPATGPEANQLAIYKPGRGFELGTTVTVSQRSELGEPEASELQIRRSNRLATLPSPILLALRPFFPLLFLHCCDCGACKTQNIQTILPQFVHWQLTANV